MHDSLASRIQAANAALFAKGDVDAVGEFFAPDYVAHLTDRDMRGGHDWIREFLRMISPARQEALTHRPMVRTGAGE